LPEEMFADLFKAGRAAVGSGGGDRFGDRVQTWNNLSDAEAVEAGRSNCGGRPRVRLAVTAKGFHPTTLTVVRGQARRSRARTGIFDAVREVVSQTGVLTGRPASVGITILETRSPRKGHGDSVDSRDHRVAREVPGAAEVIVEHCQPMTTPAE